MWLIMNNGSPVRDALYCALARHTEIRLPDDRKRPLGRHRRVWVQQISQGASVMPWDYGGESKPSLLLDHRDPKEQ